MCLRMHSGDATDFIDEVVDLFFNILFIVAFFKSLHNLRWRVPQIRASVYNKFDLFSFPLKIQHIYKGKLH